MGLYGDMHNGGQQAMYVWPGRRSKDTYTNPAAPLTRHTLSAIAEKGTVLFIARSPKRGSRRTCARDSQAHFHAIVVENCQLSVRAWNRAVSGSLQG